MFETTLTPDHTAALEAAQVINLAVFTTATTPQSPPVSIGGKLIGGRYARAHYEKLHGAGANCAARLRVLAVRLMPAGAEYAWDMDALSPTQQAALVRRTAHGKHLVGHDMARVLMWLLQYAPDLQPAKVFDTLLLARIDPSLAWNLHVLAADGNPHAKKLIQHTDGEAPCSLAALHISATGRPMEAAWGDPHNWALKNLSQGHRDGVTTYLDAQVLVFAKIDDRHIMSYSHIKIWQHQPIRMARMSHRGMPISRDRLAGIKAARTARIAATVPVLISHIPGLAEHAPRLAAGTSSVPDDVKHVLADYAHENGYSLDKGATGVPIISAKKARLRGTDKLPGWAAWNTLQSAKQVSALCDIISTYSKPDAAHPTHRSLHPVFSQSTVTLRCATEAPTVQNFPRPEAVPSDFMPGAADREEAYALLQLRSVVEALPGWVIISADYAQIELRIAAALALRAIAEAKAAKRGEYPAPAWVLDALALGESDSVIDMSATGFDAHKNALATAWRGVVTRGTPMAEIFRRGLDPHLLTGLGIAARKGFPVQGTPMEHLSALDNDGTTALKVEIASDRQSAKPTNFGLLYGAKAKTLWTQGVQDYGLEWTLEDAEQARDVWMHDYCDMQFWQLWTSYVHKSSKAETIDLYRKNSYTGEIETKPHQMRTATTLLGKPIYTPELRECLNHQSQATGAEMIALAIKNLGSAEEYLVNLVHDELVAHCPEDQTESVKAEIEKCMLDAANQVLGPWGIPAEVDVKVSKRWGK